MKKPRNKNDAVLNTNINSRMLRRKEKRKEIIEAIKKNNNTFWGTQLP
jgi:hypothetical protein